MVVLRDPVTYNRGSGIRYEVAQGGVSIQQMYLLNPKMHVDQIKSHSDIQGSFQVTACVYMSYKRETDKWCGNI